MKLWWMNFSLWRIHFSFPRNQGLFFGENYLDLLTFKSFRLDATCKTASWIYSTVFDNLLRKSSRYTSSIIGNNNNDASKRTSYIFWWDKFFTNSINIILTFCVNQLLPLNSFYFIFLQTFCIYQLHCLLRLEQLNDRVNFHLVAE